MSTPACVRVRKDSFARLSGELNALEQERFDQHRRGCAACHQFVSDLEIGVAEARREPPALSVEDRDQVYEALARTIARDPSVARGPVAPRPGRRVMPVVLALAACAVLALLLGLVGRLAHRPAREARPDAMVEASPAPGIRLRATAGTIWRLDGGAQDPVLAVDRGAVYLSVAPRPAGHPLRVRAPGVVVRVIGTVLFVRAGQDPTEVGVARGVVLVEPVGGAPQRLEAGLQWTAPHRITPIAARDRRVVRGWLATSAHAPVASSTPIAEPVATEQPAPIASREPSAPGAERRAPAPAEIPAAAEPVPPDGARGPQPLSYQDAERALAAGDARAAAALLEGVVAARPGTLDADTARLELANLYAGPLAHTDRAVAHLRVLLGGNPTAPGREAARRLLCRLAPADSACIIPSAPSDYH